MEVEWWNIKLMKTIWWELQKEIIIKNITLKELFGKNSNINFYKKSDLEKDYEKWKINKYKLSLWWFNKLFSTNFKSIKLWNNDISDFDRKHWTDWHKKLREIDELISFMKEAYFKENTDDFPNIDFNLERKQKTEK